MSLLRRCDRCKKDISGNRYIIVLAMAKNRVTGDETKGYKANFDICEDCYHEIENPFYVPATDQPDK